MKRYSTDYFEKKYRILLDKLLQKEGFEEHIQALRKELGLPKDGFTSSPELGFFLIKKLTKDQLHTLTFYAFVEAYAFQKKIPVNDDTREEIVNAFLKEQKKPKGKGVLRRTSMTRSCRS